jgi:hypothetical protein
VHGHDLPFSWHSSPFSLALFQVLALFEHLPSPSDDRLVMSIIPVLRQGTWIFIAANRKANA